MIRRGASGVALLLSVNFPSLLFSAHVPTLKMDTRYQARKPHMSTMTVWQSSVMKDTLWRAAVRSVAKPIIPGILKYRLVKKVNSPMRENRVFTYYSHLPHKTTLMGKVNRTQITILFLLFVTMFHVCVMYVHYVNGSCIPDIFRVDTERTYL